MKKSLVTGLLLITSLTTTAQLKDYGGLRVFLRQTIANSATESKRVGYLGAGFDLQMGNFEGEKFQMSYRNRVVGDFVSLINISNIETLLTEGIDLSTGLVGWWNFGYTIFKTENFNVAPGLSLHDYLYELDNVEPNGWYFALGPCVFIDYALGSSNLTTHLEISYLPSFARTSADIDDLGENYDENAEKPHFFNVQAELRYKKVFIGISPVKVINRYEPTKNLGRAPRVDIMLGFKF